MPYRKEYMDMWRAENGDKISEYSQRYRDKYQVEINQRNRERRTANPEKDRLYKRDWRASHLNLVRGYQHCHYETNKERILERMRQERYDLKVEVLSHYSVFHSPTCIKCGEDDLDVLCLDHIHGGGNQERREINRFGGNAFYRWIRTNGFPVGYQVLCANCNMRKAIREKR